VSTNQLIRRSTVIAVTGIAAVGAWASYSHALDVVRAYGVTGVLAYAYPATIDGLIYAASMVLLDSARRNIAAPGLARWLLGVGIVVTLGVNVTAGLHHGAVGAVVSAWPALALVGSYELLMSMIRREAAPVSVPMPDGVPGTAADTVPGGVSGSVPGSVPVDGVSHVPVPRVRTVAAKRSPGRARVNKARVPEKIFSAEIERGELPSLREVMRRARCGADRARTIRDELSRGLEATVNA
jgi:hypothetical protein